MPLSPEELKAVEKTALKKKNAINAQVNQRPIQAPQLGVLLQLSPPDITTRLTQLYGGVYDNKFAVVEKDHKAWGDLIDEANKGCANIPNPSMLFGRQVALLREAHDAIRVVAKDGNCRGYLAITKFIVELQKLPQRLEPLRRLETDYDAYLNKIPKPDAKGTLDHRARQLLITGATLLLKTIDSICRIDEATAKAANPFAKNGYVKQSYTTAWNSPVTFSWEREGNSETILDIYGPDFTVKPRHGFRKVNVAQGGQPAEDLWDEVKRRYPPNAKPAIWERLEGHYLNGITPAIWNAFTPLEKRAFMVANDLYYGDMLKLPWNDLIPLQQALFMKLGKDDAQANTKILGSALYDDLTPFLDSEVSDQDPYTTGELVFAEVMAREEQFSNRGLYKDILFDFNPRVWEIKHASYTDDLAKLFAELGWLAIHFDGGKGMEPGDEMPATLDISKADANLQVHVVCRRPGAHLDNWAPKFSGLAHMLNDRGALHDWAEEASDVHSKYLGPYLQEYDAELNTLLQQAHIPQVVYNKGPKTYFNGNVDVTNNDAYIEAQKNSIEFPDTSSHQIGKWKFGVVSLRHHYGDPELLGFEIRSLTDPMFRTVLINLASALRDWADWSKALDEDKSTIKLTSAAAYPIAKLSDVDHTGKDTLARVPLDLQQIMTEAFEAVPHDARPYEAPDVEGVLIKRWAFPYVKWEEHPAVIANGGKDITKKITEARAAFATAAAKKAPNDAVTQMRQKIANEGVKRGNQAPQVDNALQGEIIEAAVQQFCATTGLWKLF